MTRARQYPHPPPDPQMLAAEIADTRAALGDTMSALAAKADVKARVSDRVSSLKARTTELRTDAVDKVRHNPMPLVAAAAGTVVAIFLIARRRRR